MSLTVPSNKYHKTVSRIIELLDERGYWFETFEHALACTCDEVADKRKGYTLDQGAKALIVRVTFSKDY